MVADPNHNPAAGALLPLTGSEASPRPTDGESVGGGEIQSPALAAAAGAEPGVAPKGEAKGAARPTPDRRPGQRRGAKSEAKGAARPTPEARVTVLAATSRMADATGRGVPRGRAVSIPQGRLQRLLEKGWVREASKAELEAALRRAPLVEVVV